MKLDMISGGTGESEGDASPRNIISNRIARVGDLLVTHEWLC